MSENGIPDVGRVELDVALRRNQAGAAQAPNMAAKNATDGVAARGVTKGAEAAQPTKEEQSNSLVDISLKFQVDAETQDVTILILDRASRRVVRTIPPEEMSSLDPGELLQLFA